MYFAAASEPLVPVRRPSSFSDARYVTCSRNLSTLGAGACCAKASDEKIVMRSVEEKSFRNITYLVEVEESVRRIRTGSGSDQVPATTTRPGRSKPYSIRIPKFRLFNPICNEDVG